MLKKDNRKIRLYRPVIIFSILFIICLEIYTMFVSFQTVNVTSFDVEIAGGIIEINEDKKTFNINDSNGNLIKTSKVYNEVLNFNWTKIAVIDTDNKLKIIDHNENVLVTFEGFSLNIEDIKSSSIYEDFNIIKVSFEEIKNEKNSIINYCYNKDTKEAYVEKNFEN